MPVREQDGATSAPVAESLRDGQRTVAADERWAAPADRKGLLALLAGVACTVLGSRLVVISAFGSPVPVLDQWDGEGAALYAPYLKGTLSFGELIASHNGHRILITRLFALAHLELAGEWNTRLEMVFGAVVLTAFVTWLLVLLMPLVAPQRRLLLSCFVALAFAFPIDYENTVWGFQSQVYLSLLAGLAALAAFASAAAFSLRWFGGLAAGILAYFTFATGVAALVAAAALVSLQLATNSRRRCGREVAAVVVIGSIAGALTLWGAASAQTMSNLWTFVAGLLIFTALTIVGAVPIMWFWRRSLASRPGVSDRAWVVVGISTWVAIQLVLFAYGRGDLVAPRYMDVVLLVYPMALVAVLLRSDRGASRRSAVIWVSAVVLAITVVGCASVIAASLWSRAADQQLANVTAYLATGDVNQLKERGSPSLGPILNHPDPVRHAHLLQDPDIRAVLPPEIRPGDADNAGARDRMFLNGSLSGVTRELVHGVLLLGPAFLALGVGLLIAVGTFHRRWMRIAN